MNKSVVYTISILVVLLSVLLTGCGGGNGATGASNSAPLRFRSLEFTLTTQKATYARGEPVPLTFTVTNVGSRSVDTTYPSSALYTIQGMLGNQVIWYDPAGGFEPKPVSYAPGETKTFAVMWTQTDLNNNPVPRGTYSISAWVPADSVDGLAFTVQDAKTKLAARPLEITLLP